MSEVNKNVPMADTAGTNAVSAEVAHEPRRLYKNGVSVMVAAEDVATLLSDGWLLHSPADIPVLHSSIGAACDALNAAVGAFVTELQDSKGLNTDTGGAYVALNAAVADLANQVGELLSIAHQSYPVKATGDAVELVDPEGITRIVPANQAAAYKDAYSKGQRIPNVVTVEHKSEEMQLGMKRTVDTQNATVNEEVVMGPARKTIFEIELPAYEAEGWVKV